MEWIEPMTPDTLWQQLASPSGLNGYRADESGRNGRGFSPDGPWHIFLTRDGAFVGIVEARTRAEARRRAVEFAGELKP